MGIKNLFEDGTMNSVEDVLEYAKTQSNYQYIWAQQLNRVVLGFLDDVEIELEKLTEARIFGDGCEIHIFRQDEWSAIEIDHWKEEYFDEMQKIKKTDRERFGTAIKIRHYIDFESDGQAYICGSCLNGWEA